VDLPIDHLLPVVMAVLTKKYPTVQFHTDTPFEDGLGGDSQALLDIILEIENASGTEFNAEFFDLDMAVTPMRLARAFKPS
jgi:acyl carrier protein